MATKHEEVKKLSLADLKPREYEFEVVTPDDDHLVFTMRAPTQAEMWEVERSEPVPIRDYFLNDKMPFMKASDGEVKPMLDESAYQTALENRAQRVLNRKALRAWANAAEVLGTANEEEQLTAMAELSSWAISALWKITQSLISTTSDAIAARKFRGH